MITMGNFKSIWFNTEECPETGNDETSSSKSKTLSLMSLMPKETVNGVKTLSEEVENTEKANGESSIKIKRRKRKKKKSQVDDGQLVDTNITRSLSQEEVENTEKADGEASIKRKRKKRTKKKKLATRVILNPRDDLADTEIANCGQHDTPSSEELQSQVNAGHLIDTNIVRSLSEKEIKANGEASIKRKRKRRKKKKSATSVIQNPQDKIEDTEVTDGQLIDTNIFRSLSGKPTIGNVGIWNNKDFVSRSKKMLLILDVNGLLGDVIHPPPKGCKPDVKISRRAIFKRPFLDDFLGFCFERFDVAIWSSRTRKILDPVVDYLLGDLKKKLVFLWDLSHCTNSRARSLENRHKFIVFKKLDKIWEENSLIASQRRYYDESNTLLLDDSPYKALLNPKHTGIFPFSYNHRDTNDNSLGPDGDLRIYLEGVANSENVKTYVEQHPFGQRAIDETSPDWAFYSKAIRNVF